jgi:hypothetical protein
MRTELIPELPASSQSAIPTHGYVSHHPGIADAEKYRDEAERLPNEAAETGDGETREAALNIAKLCDRLAQTLAKQRGKPNG